MIQAAYHQKSLVVKILCDAFDSNKSVNYFVQQDRKRAQRIKILMEYAFEMCSLFGNIYLSEDLNACALVLYPDKQKTTLKTVLLDMKVALGAVGIFRVRKMLDREKQVAKHYPSQPILYVWFFAVDPREQGKGNGAKLLHEIMNKGNVEKRPIYLESSMPQSLEFYKKAGFEIYNEIEFAYKLFLLRKQV